MESNVRYGFTPKRIRQFHSNGPRQAFRQDFYGSPNTLRRRYSGERSFNYMTDFQEERNDDFTTNSWLCECQSYNNTSLCQTCGNDKNYLQTNKTNVQQKTVTKTLVLRNLDTFVSEENVLEAIKDNCATKVLHSIASITLRNTHNSCTAYVNFNNVWDSMYAFKDIISLQSPLLVLQKPVQISYSVIPSSDGSDNEQLDESVQFVPHPPRSPPISIASSSDNDERHQQSEENSAATEQSSSNDDVTEIYRQSTMIIRSEGNCYPRQKRAYSRSHETRGFNEGSSKKHKQIIDDPESLNTYIAESNIPEYFNDSSSPRPGTSASTHREGNTSRQLKKRLSETHVTNSGQFPPHMGHNGNGSNFMYEHGPDNGFNSKSVNKTGNCNKETENGHNHTMFDNRSKPTVFGEDKNNTQEQFEILDTAEEMVVGVTTKEGITEAESCMLRNILKEELIKLALESTETTFAPTFTGRPNYKSNCLQLWCKNYSTFKWLQHIMSKTTLSSGEEILIKRWCDVNRTIHCGIYLPNIGKTPEEVGKILAFQNPWAQINRWQVGKVKERTRKELFVHVSIPEEVIQVIVDHDRRLSFLTGFVTVRFLERLNIRRL